MIEWYEGITKTEFNNAINEAAVEALRNGVDSKAAYYDDFVLAHLKMWKDSNIEAPLNELQSLHSWLRFSGTNTKEQIQDAMRMRMVLLMEAANKLHEEGPEAEEAAGIYENRPEMRPKRNDCERPNS